MNNDNTETDSRFTSTRETPWQQLGRSVRDAKSIANAIELAGLDWEVHQAPVRYFDGTQDHTVDFVRVNYRADTGELLGVVSDIYTVVQNRTIFAFADRLLGAGLQYDLAGVIQNGSRVWLQGHLPEINILGDLFSPNLLFSNGHDGKTAIQVYMTPTRICCANMLNLAIRSANQKWFLPHVRTVREKMLDAGKTLEQSGQYMNELAWKAETLATAKLGRNDLRRFIEKMFPEQDTDRKNNRLKREIERFRDCYFVDDLENFKGTKWGLLLAVSDFVTHKPVRTIRQRETHFSRMVEGHELLDKAYELIDML